MTSSKAAGRLEDVAVDIAVAAAAAADVAARVVDSIAHQADEGMEIMRVANYCRRMQLTARVDAEVTDRRCGW